MQKFKKTIACFLSTLMLLSSIQSAGFVPSRTELNGVDLTKPASETDPTITYNPDGSITVVGEATFTTPNPELVSSVKVSDMATMDASSILKINETNQKGIIANVENGGFVRIEVNAYDGERLSGLIYGGEVNSSTTEYNLHKTWNIRKKRNNFSPYVDINSSDIRSLSNHTNGYIYPKRRHKRFVCGGLCVLGAGIATAALTSIYISWSAQVESPTHNFNKEVDLKESTPKLQPIVAKVIVKDATIKGVKSPGSADLLKLLKKEKTTQKDPLEKIISALDKRENGKLWSITRDNKSVKILATPKKNQVVKSEEFQNIVIQTLKSGKKFIDITTLLKIDDGWLEHLASALVSIEKDAVKNSTKPIVRIYLGMDGLLTGKTDNAINRGLRRILGTVGIPFPYTGTAEARWDDHFKDILTKLTKELKGKSNLQIFIGGGRTPFSSLIHERSFNHSKIIAIDGEKSIIGGHNLWDQYLWDIAPLDTSILVEGKATKSAHKFADEIWKKHMYQFPKTHIISWKKGTIKSETNVPLASNKINLLPSENTDGIDILSVGQLGQSDGDSQIKKAVLAMINSAEQSIYISQQALSHIKAFEYYNGVTDENVLKHIFNTVDKELIKALLEKAINGVKVKIILSNNEAPHDTGIPVSNNYLLGMMWKAATSLGIDESNKGLLCENLKIGSIRIDDNSETYPETDKPFANHSKTVMIDREMFLIGSHNLYSQFPFQLYEFGYIIADKKAADDYYNQYWEPVLKNSERTFNDELSCFSAIGLGPMKKRKKREIEKDEVVIYHTESTNDYSIESNYTKPIKVTIYNITGLMVKKPMYILANDRISGYGLKTGYYIISSSIKKDGKEKIINQIVYKK